MLKQAHYTFKSAAVPRPLKDERRALAMIHGGGYAMHGTSPEGAQKILEDGLIAPGSENAFSPMGVKEVYLGKDLPAYAWMNRHKPGFAIPTEKILGLTGPLSESAERLNLKPRVIPNAAYMSGSTEGPSRGSASDFVVSPHPVPVGQKGYFIAKPDLIGTLKAPIREFRLRTLPASTYYNAMTALKPPSRQNYG